MSANTIYSDFFVGENQSRCGNFEFEPPKSIDYTLYITHIFVSKKQRSASHIIDKMHITFQMEK